MTVVLSGSESVWLVLGSSHQCLQTWVSSGVMTESTAACGNGDAAFEPSSVLRLHAARSRPDPATSCLLPAARVGLGRPAGRVPGRGPAPHAIAETVSARACSFRVFSRIALAARVTHACLRVQSAVPLEARPIFPLTGCLVPKIARALVLFSMHVHGGRGASCGNWHIGLRWALPATA